MPNEIDFEYLGSFVDEYDRLVEEGEDSYRLHLDEYWVALSLVMELYLDLKEKDRVTPRIPSAEYDFEKEMQLQRSYVPCVRLEVVLRGPEKSSPALEFLWPVLQGPDIQLIKFGNGEVALITTVLQQLTGDRSRDRKKIQKGLSRIEAKFKRFHLWQDGLRG